MWNNDFFDYIEIRRRIERQLPGAQQVFGHLALFLLAVIAFVTIRYGQYSVNPWPGYGLEPGLAYAMTFWSILLLIHGLWAYRRSGAAGAARERAVERELEKRIGQDDTGLLADHRRVFRIRGLLDEDIRLRSGLFIWLLSFLAVNATTWVIWASAGARSSYTLQMTIPTAIAFVAPALVLNLWRRRRRDRKLQRLMSEQAPQAAKAKRKRSFDEMAERAVRLSDDGELVNADDDLDELREATQAKS